MKPRVVRFALIGSLMLTLSACGAVLAGTAGGLIVDEGIVENDGKFDPLENTELGEAIYE